MTTTGYTDVFARTVAGGLGTATSGQAYTLTGAASQFSVSGGVGSVTVSATGNNYGLAEAQDAFPDVSGQVSLSAIPATNLAAVGFALLGRSGGNLYTGSMMVATGGAISLRFTRIFGGATVTLATIGTGLTYVANAIYNLRVQAFWSRLLQTNVLSAKLWAANAAEPGGWMATTNDAYFTDYTAGTAVGLYARDESAALGTIARFRSVSSVSYHLPVPDPADPACADPAFAFPKQTALKSLADAVDTQVQALDGLAVQLPRVRVSGSMSQSNQFSFNCVFNATEFNVGTPTNLGYNSAALLLPIGIWLLTFEMLWTSGSTNSLQASFYGGPNTYQQYMRPWATQSNDQGINGAGHASLLTYSTNPATPNQFGVSIIPTNTATTINIKYMALSALKISDYFT